MTDRPEREKREPRPFAFWFLASIVVPMVGIMMKIRIRPGDSLPLSGAYVLAPNHYTEVDPLIVAVATWRLGRPPRFMTKQSLFSVPVLGWALRATGMVPVARGSSSASARKTLEASEILVREGRGVIVYPEGTLTRDPDMWPMRGKTGAVRLALEADIPLIPMASWGGHKVMPRYAKKLNLWPPRKPVTVAIGKPVDLSDLRGQHTKPMVLAEATTRLMNAITTLLEDLRDEKAPDVRWNPLEHGQKETGRFES